MTNRRILSRAALAFAWIALAGCGDIQAPSPDFAPPAPLSIAPALGSTLGGQLVAIQGAEFTEGSAVLFDGVPATSVRVESAAVITAVTPAHAEGTVTVTVFDRLGRQSSLEGAYTYRRSFDQAGRPRLVSAVSTSNTTVRVIFSEPVAEGASSVDHYSVTHANVNAEAGTILVKSAAPSADGTFVDLVTSSQNEVIYQLAASNIRDLDGNLLAPPELLVNPSVVDFAGTPPSSANGTLIDTDGDGLFDNVEVGGWAVTVWLTNGDVDLSTHTSDPNVADTDGDGLDDSDELLAGSNPREADTDGDGVTDAVEWNEWWSDPSKQDTDEDGLSDAIDLLFETSPILDDTDGDGYLDYDELFELSRNPLIADLPRPKIVVSSFDLTLDVTSSYTDETGTTHSIESTATTSVSQTNASALGRSDTRSTESANQFSQEFGGEIGYDDGPVGKVFANAGFEQSRAEGYSSTVESVTASELQQSYDDSVSEALETSEGRSVTRTIDAARVVATVNVANASTVPFTVENLEITVMRQDRRREGEFRPVATLRPAGGDDLALTLGPLDSERGPIVFENTEIFPNLVEELMLEPTGLVFEIANFDVTDEQGRNFAYTSANVNSRTAGITIDYGDGRTSSHRVAVHNRFDASGRATGITITRGLELIGLGVTPNDVPLPDTLPTPVPAAIRSSVGTRVDLDGVERLVRVGTTQNDFDPTDPEKRFWTIQTNNDALGPDVPFSSIVLQAGHEYLLMYVSDVDEDTLYDRAERIYGSLDTDADSDDDTIPDVDEVRVGWSVRVSPGTEYRVFSSPGRFDSDLDGLSDLEERTHGTDPNRDDTDADGITDALEIDGNLSVRLRDGDTDDLNDVTLSIASYRTDVVITNPGPSQVTAYRAVVWAGRDRRCDTVAAGDDVQVIAAGTSGLAPDAACVHGGPNAVLDATIPQASDDAQRAIHDGEFGLDPRRADTDADGLPDGRELLIGTNPNLRDAGGVLDSDGDGLFDEEERRGWDVSATKVVGGAPVVVHVDSNPLSVDTDSDGLSDLYENAIYSNPRAFDTDDDRLGDKIEFDVSDLDRNYDALRLWNASRRCTEALRCTPPAIVPVAQRLRTDVRQCDSDDDSRSDYDETYVPWTVTVSRLSGQTFTSVYSKAYDHDIDRDGLWDGDEQSNTTNPNVADTDGDGGGDDYELGVAHGGATRDPHVPDRLVHVHLPQRVDVVANCNEPFAPDFTDDAVVGYWGDLTLVRPDGSSVTPFHFWSCNNQPDGGWCSASPEAFFMREGQSFWYWSTAITDSDSTDPEYTNAISGQFFDYNVLTSAGSISRQHELADYRSADRTNLCKFQVGVRIWVE